MELGRFAHDAVLHQLEEPREQHLRQELESIAPGARVVDEMAPHARARSNEKSRLLMAGSHVVQVDKELDWDAISHKFSDEERAAVIADSKLPMAEIVQHEMKQLIAMAVPLIFGAVLEMFPPMLLSMMVGRVDPARSAEILAACALSSTLNVLTVGGLTDGFGSAMDTMCSQAFGAKRLREMWLLLQGGLIIYVCCTPVVMALLLNGEWIMVRLGQEPAIAATAVSVLLVYALTTPFVLATALIKSSLQAQNIVTPLVATSLGSWAVSLPISYALGFHTSLGFVGVIMANGLYNIVKLVSLVPVMYCNEAFISEWPGWNFLEVGQLLRNAARMGLAGLLMTTLQTAGSNYISVVAGLLPNAAIMISVNTIFVGVVGITFLPLLGLSVAGSIRTGNALGGGMARRASIVGHMVVALCVAVATTMTVIFLLFGDTLARSFTTDAEVLAQSSQAIHQLFPIIPLMGLAYGIEAVYRACGKQWLCSQLTFAFVLGVGIPAGIWFAVGLDAGILGLWYGRICGKICYTAVGCIWLWTLNWNEMAHEARLNTHVHVEEPVSEDILN